MENISVYDVRQLKLMHANLIAYENKEIGLNSLVGTLEFLFNVLESDSIDWEEEFFNEITNLDTINSLEIINASGEEICEIEEIKKKFLINRSVQNLKKLIENDINE